MILTSLIAGQVAKCPDIAGAIDIISPVMTSSTSFVPAPKIAIQSGAIPTPVIPVITPASRIVFPVVI